AGADRREALRKRRAAHVLAHLASRARAGGVTLEPRRVVHVERARTERGRHASQSITHHSLPPRTSAPPPASGTTATRASTRSRGAVRYSTPAASASAPVSPSPMLVSRTSRRARSSNALASLNRWCTLSATIWLRSSVSERAASAK